MRHRLVSFLLPLAIIAASLQTDDARVLRRDARSVCQEKITGLVMVISEAAAEPRNRRLSVPFSRAERVALRQHAAGLGIYESELIRRLAEPLLESIMRSDQSDRPANRPTAESR